MRPIKAELRILSAFMQRLLSFIVRAGAVNLPQKQKSLYMLGLTGDLWKDKAAF